MGYALLGLIQQKPSSGYDLRKIFAETAMGNYSSSPGAIYPALERLEAKRLIRGEVTGSIGLRRRKAYRLTARGEAELKQWLSRPIVPNDVTRAAGELMLRFAFMEQVLGSSVAIDFLAQFSAALKAYIPGLESYLLNNAPHMPLSARLALESGIRGYQSLQEWTRYAIRQYRKSQTNQTSRPAQST
jgi:DNA-binding PadR family transcriptional regulator